MKERDQELCESPGGRPGLPVLKSPYGLCRHKGTLKNRVQELYESPGGCPGLPVLNSLYGLCGRQATFEEEKEGTQTRPSGETCSQGSGTLCNPQKKDENLETPESTCREHVVI